MFFTNLAIARLMFDTEFLAIPYWKTVNNELGTSEGNILHVYRTDGFGILTLFHMVEGFFQKKKCSQTGRKIVFDRDQTFGRVRPNSWLWSTKQLAATDQINWSRLTRQLAAIDGTTGRDGLVISARGRWHYAKYYQ